MVVRRGAERVIVVVIAVWIGVNAVREVKDTAADINNTRESEAGERGEKGERKCLTLH